MTRYAVRRLADSLLALACLAAVSILAACGGGGVSGPATTTGTLAISPTTAVVYSDVPAKFVVTGGTAPYFITSSNGAALPVPSGAFNYNTLMLVPGTVGADTSVTLSATDALSSTSVSSTVTVKPRTVSNVVTITPNPSQAASCGTAVCAGGDAQVRVLLSQGGVPLAGRAVQFAVASGPLSIITSTSGGIETLSSVGTAVTDSTGTATIRVRAGETSTPQTALIDITDLSTGSSVRTGVSISPLGNVALAAQPASISFQGVDSNSCANGTSADVIVFGGRAPYSISQPAGFFITPTLVTSNPGRFTVTSTGQCSSSAPIGIVDANGASTSVTVTNQTSSIPPTPTPAFTVAPDTVTLATCTDVASVTLAGGTGTYYAAGGSDLIFAYMLDANTAQIRRKPATGGTGSSSTVTVNAGFSDGRSTTAVKVNLIGSALGPC